MFIGKQNRKYHKMKPLNGLTIKFNIESKTWFTKSSLEQLLLKYVKWIHQDEHMSWTGYGEFITETNIII